MSEPDYKRLSETMAQYILSRVPLECECCINPMRNMNWDAPVKGCDGNCEYSHIPEPVEEVIQLFSE